MSKPIRQIGTKSPAEIQALSIHGHQANTQNAEDMKKLLSLLTNFEKTYSEPYCIALSFEKTQEDKIFKDYFIHALNNVKLKFQSSETFSASDYLNSRTDADNSVKQFVVILQKHRSGEYKLNFRIGDKQHATLGIGNDHLLKYLAIPTIKELKTTPAQQVAVSMPAAASTTTDAKQKNINISPNTTPNTKSRVISAAKIPLDAYKEVTKHHFISEMPIVLLAGEIIYSTNPLTGKPQLEVNDKSGAFHFENDFLPMASNPTVELPGTAVEGTSPNSVTFDKGITRIYDQRLCAEQVMRIVGLTGDLIRYVPKVEIDMSRDPRKLNKTVHPIQSEMHNQAENPHGNEKLRKEISTLVWSESATATASAAASSVVIPAANAPAVTFSVAADATAVTVAIPALPPNQNLSPILQAAIGNTAITERAPQPIVQNEDTTECCPKNCVIL